MQGQIVRVKGTFSRGNLPKLSDFDTSFLLQEILKHESCKHFYDLSNTSAMVLEDGKAVSISDLKGGNPITATLAQAPTYDQTLFGGRGGLVFSGAQRMLGNGLFQETTTTINVSFQANAANGANNFILIPTVGTSGGSLYFNNNAIRSFSAGLFKNTESTFKRTNLSNIYKPDLLFKTTINEEVLAMTAAGQAYHMVKENSVLNVGSSATPASYGNFNLGHIAIFETDISTDAYLFELVNEFHKRQYNI